MTTTNNDRLNDILNDTPNGDTPKPKKKTSDPAPSHGARERARSKTTTKDRGQSAGLAQIGQLAERNRQVADKITALNAQQTASFIVQDYVDGTFMQKTLDELDLMLEGFQSAFEEGLTLEGSEETDPLFLPSVSGSSSEDELEEEATYQTA